MGGGAERVLVGLVRSFKAEGHDCCVVALTPPYDLAGELISAGIEFHPLDLGSPLEAPRALWRLKRISDAFRPDVLWGHLLYGNLYSAWLTLWPGRARCVWTLHSRLHLDAAGASWKTRFRLALEGWTGRLLADSFVSVSAATAASHKDLHGWDGIRVIHNGVEAPSAARDVVMPPRNGSPMSIVVPARLVRDKGQHVLLDALASPALAGTPVRCDFVGEGPLRGELESLAASLGLADRVRFLGVLPHDSLLDMFAKSDAVVLPSLREPFGIAAAEAMSLGTPTLVTRVDGLIELAGADEGALTVEPGDPAALAVGIRSILKDPALRERLRESGPRRVRERFSLESQSKKWLAHFEALR